MNAYASMLPHLLEIEWGGRATNDYKCPSCGAHKQADNGEHEKDCALSVLIQKCRHEVKRGE